MRIRIVFPLGLAALGFMYLLFYGIHGPQIWQVYPFNGGPMPAEPPKLYAQ